MRKDGRRLKNVDPMYSVASYVMSERSDSMNMITVNVPLSPIQSYINAKRKEGVSISHLAVIIAAYVRTMCKYPYLNRFIVNKRPYARNEISVAMVVLKAGKMDNGTMAKMYFKPEDTVFDVNDKINKFVAENRDTPENNGTEKLIKILKLPGLLNIGVGLIKFMDKHGILPKAILDMSPFHNSMVISNLQSIRTNHIYHHCYNFGTTSVIMTIGNNIDVPKEKDGKIYLERNIPLGVVMDERICSGSYFAMAFREMKKYLKKPAVLEEKPDEIVEDDG